MKEEREEIQRGGRVQRMFKVLRTTSLFKYKIDQLLMAQKVNVLSYHYKSPTVSGPSQWRVVHTLHMLDFSLMLPDLDFDKEENPGFKLSLQTLRVISQSVVDTRRITSASFSCNSFLSASSTSWDLRGLWKLLFTNDAVESSLLLMKIRRWVKWPGSN